MLEEDSWSCKPKDPSPLLLDTAAKQFNHHDVEPPSNIARYVSSRTNSAVIGQWCNSRPGFSFGTKLSLTSAKHLKSVKGLKF